MAYGLEEGVLATQGQLPVEAVVGDDAFGVACEVVGLEQEVVGLVMQRYKQYLIWQNFFIEKYNYFPTAMQGLRVQRSSRIFEWKYKQRANDR